MNSPTVITDPAQIDKHWLETALRRAGALNDGGIQSIELGVRQRHAWSRIVPITVRYTRGSTGQRPEHLLLKLCSGEGGVFGPAEVMYYTRDYAGLVGGPVARCFDAAFEGAPRRYHVLLEDLSATHFNADHVTPDERYAMALAEAFAALHAHRWGEQRLRAIGLAPPAFEDFARYVAHVRQGLEPMLASVGRRLGARWSARLRDLVARLPARYAERACDLRGITQIHGDANPGNILVPRDGAGRIVLIDRQPFDWSLTHWLGASDIVYAIVLWWEPATRRRLEVPMLKRYHGALRERGIVDWPWDLLWDDYRLCIAEALMVAIEWQVLEADRERMRWLWERELQWATTAFDELGCEALWDPG